MTQHQLSEICRAKTAAEDAYRALSLALTTLDHAFSLGNCGRDAGEAREAINRADSLARKAVMLLDDVQEAHTC